MKEAEFDLVPGDAVGDVKMTKDDGREFLGALRRAWSFGTSPQWLPADPARGQGPVTALVVQDHFGGEILKTPIGNDWHFYNRVAEKFYDFAAEQFSELPAYLNIPSSRDEALANSAPERYQALAAGVTESLKMRHALAVRDPRRLIGTRC